MLAPMLSDLAIIVPVAPRDPTWAALAQDFAALPRGPEVIFAGPKPPLIDAKMSAAALSGREHRLAWVRTPLGRAAQMNHAARATARRFLWFVHADSRLTPAALGALSRAVAAAPAALHYFDLAFETRDDPRMALNNVGVWIRSHLLKMPFGDQGFCLPRATFLELGGFDETARYGEDHLLVWKARRRGIALRCTGAPIGTSARKYREHGWLKTTVRHQALTAAQALPEAWKLWRGAP